MAVNRSWATANPGVAKRFVDVFVESIAWFEDTRNRDEAVKMMTDISKLKKEDVERAYDFLREKKLFEPTGKVSRAKLQSVIDALRELGDVQGQLALDRLILPGVTALSD